MKQELFSTKQQTNDLRYSVEDATIRRETLATGTLLVLVLIKAASDVIVLILQIIKSLIR